MGSGWDLGVEAYRSPNDIPAIEWGGFSRFEVDFAARRLAFTLDFTWIATADGPRLGLLHCSTDTLLELAGGYPSGPAPIDITSTDVFREVPRGELGWQVPEDSGPEFRFVPGGRSRGGKSGDLRRFQCDGGVLEVDWVCEDISLEIEFRPPHPDWWAPTGYSGPWLWYPSEEWFRWDAP